MVQSPRDSDSERGAVHVMLATTHEEALLAACDAVLSFDERARRDRFVVERDRQLATLSRGMRRLLLARETGIAPEALLFREGPYGKPELTSDPDVRFNASHSGDIVALAIAHGRDVGVDVELVRAERDLRAMAAYSFSERERSDLAALAPQQFVAGFYSCWTQKEAFLKLIGAGLSQPLDAFDVEVDPAKQPALLASRMTGTKAPPCRMVRIPAGGGYAATLAMADTPVVHRVTCAWYLGDGALLTPSSVPVRDGIA